ncbi:hypothetical protein Rhopal_005126-T1 [Rhodotorula paludigena]|uniref:Uncharacterized protein n=1 Tax=Rhodotorula paludigena TaxID=86838 RepID=A0AAV5GRW8_9BASI|nr:hypothetical protein Rhopal_005126-T1 [Rhodotorula paludigena]
MRASFVASFLALAAFVAAAPVAVVDETTSVAAVDVELAEADITFIDDDEEETTDVVNTLEKRGTKSCSKVSQCAKLAVPANAQRVCASKKCGWTCKSGYAKSGSKCVKKAAPKSSAVQFSTSASFSGKGTWFTQNGVAGSCGARNPDSALIVAMNTPQVSGGAHCGKFVTITNTANGKKVRAKVADESRA